LQASGQTVAVLDRTGVAAEASQGNAGAFAFSDIVPLATPGIMRQAPKWLFDPLGPLSIPPAYALRIAPWMLRFWRASRQSRYHGAMAAQSALMDLSRVALTKQIKDASADQMFRHEGQLQLYESTAEFQATLPAWATREAQGIPFRHLTDPDEIAEVQPGLSTRFTRASFTPDWINVSDPKAWVEHLADLFRARGGRIDKVNVVALKQTGQAVTLTTDGAPLRAARAVVCAGAWSHRLARTLGHKIPLETERGYNTTLPPGAFDLRTHLTFGGHGFVVTRIGDGIRVGGAVELGGLQPPPNFKRAKVLLAKAKSFLPALDDRGGTEWMGFRPSMPDSLPVIGAAPGSPRVTYAFGHGHLGLTQSAATAQLIADLIANRPPAIDLTPFRPNRFSVFA